MKKKKTYLTPLSIIIIVVIIIIVSIYFGVLSLKAFRGELDSEVAHLDYWIEIPKGGGETDWSIIISYYAQGSFSVDKIITAQIEFNIANESLFNRVNNTTLMIMFFDALEYPPRTITTQIGTFPQSAFCETIIQNKTTKMNCTMQFVTTGTSDYTIMFTDFDDKFFRKGNLEIQPRGGGDDNIMLALALFSIWMTILGIFLGLLMKNFPPSFLSIKKKKERRKRRKK